MFYIEVFFFKELKTFYNNFVIDGFKFSEFKNVNVTYRYVTILVMYFSNLDIIRQSERASSIDL